MKKPSFFEDVAEQPETLIRVFKEYSNGELKDRLRLAADQIRNRPVTIVSGMGSSCYAAELFTLRLNSHGMLAFAMDASELLHYRKPLLSNCLTLIGISQSGESIETCLVAENRYENVPMIGITNKEDSRLAETSNILLPLLAGEEAETSSKTYIATLAVLNLLADAVTGDAQLSSTCVEMCAEVMREVTNIMVEEVEKLLSYFGDFNSVVYTGRGPGLVSALQSALITKEMAQIHAEGISAGQFRHGPLELAGPGLLVVIFAPSGSTTDLLIKLAGETAKFGSPTWLVTDTSISVSQRPSLFVSKFPAVKEYLSPLISIIASEFLAVAIAKRNGRTPGEFTRISKITKHE